MSLFEAHLWMPEKHQKALEQSWAHIFRTQVLEMIPESQFAELFHASLGRPNEPVAILVSLSVLKEMFDLTDEALMDSYRFDMRFHYALGVTLEKTGMALRTLEGFRARVVGSEAVGATFDKVTDQIIDILGLNTSRQRHDSTHFRSNMANLTRLGLFVRTLEYFVAALAKECPDRHSALPEEILKRYGERHGRFADARASEGRRRLEDAAQDLWMLVDRFRDDRSVLMLTEYGLLERLLQEQCDIQEEDASVVLKAPKEIASDSLQSPFDPDATYDGHKGVGYQVQISETCAAENPVQMLTRVEVE
ncbi:MAG: transposase, partial [Magnetococcales bacterium]|nr:transposase [Magnetococcales bacterium]